MNSVQSFRVCTVPSVFLHCMHKRVLCVQSDSLEESVVEFVVTPKHVSRRETFYLANGSFDLRCHGCTYIRGTNAFLSTRKTGRGLPWKRIESKAAGPSCYYSPHTHSFSGRHRANKQTDRETNRHPNTQTPRHQTAKHPDTSHTARHRTAKQPASLFAPMSKQH